MTLPETAALSTTLQTVRRAFYTPRRCIQYPWVVGVDDQIHGARLVIHEQYPFPVFASVGRSKYTPLLVGTGSVAQCRDVNGFRVFGVNSDSGYLPRILQSDMFPAVATVHRFPDAVPMREVSAQGLFATPHIDDVGVGRGNRHASNGASKVPVGDVPPGGSAIIGPPNTTTGAAKIKGHRLARHPGDGTRTSATKGSNGAVLQDVKQGLPWTRGIRLTL